MAELRQRAEPLSGMVLGAFGTRVRVTFLRGRAQGQAAADDPAAGVYAAIRTSWSRCLLSTDSGEGEPGGAVPPVATHRYMARLRLLDPAAQPAYEASDGQGRSAYVLADDAAEFAQQLTTQIVVRAIGNRRGVPLLLHAGAVAAPSGDVHVLAAPSGTGKTTAMLRLCSSPGRWGYVTDETVAIEEDGTVVPFPKPLSVIETPHRPKAQRSPEDLGLLPPPPGPLRVASISLLRRVPLRKSASRTPWMRPRPCGCWFPRARAWPPCPGDWCAWPACATGWAASGSSNTAKPSRSAPSSPSWAEIRGRPSPPHGAGAPDAAGGGDARFRTPSARRRTLTPRGRPGKAVRRPDGGAWQRMTPWSSTTASRPPCWPGSGWASSLGSVPPRGKPARHRRASRRWPRRCRRSSVRTPRPDSWPNRPSTGWLPRG